MAQDQNTLQNLSALEKALLLLDQFPYEIGYRIAIGFLIFPAQKLVSKNNTIWTTAAFFVAVLIMLRVIPGVFRKIAGFSDAAKEIWFERRQQAKRYDSYQWRKLFWIGVGLASYCAIFRHAQAPQLILVSFTLIAGSLGIARWRFLTHLSETTVARAKALSHSAS